MDVFKLIQVNIQSLTKNKEEFQRSLLGSDYSAALLSETWTNSDLESTNKYNISRYHRFFNSREDNYGGVGIYLKQDWGYMEIAFPQLNRATQVVGVKIVRLDMAIVSVYVAPSITRQELEEDLTKIFESVKKYNKIIIGGDFNGHHFSWGNDFNDFKGKILMEKVDEYNVLILNDGSKTYFPVELNKKSTAIDVSLCSSAIYNDVVWKTLDYNIGSHHVAIEISYTIQTHLERDKFVFNHKKIKEKISMLDLSNLTDINEFQIKIEKFSNNVRLKINIPLNFGGLIE